MCLTGASLGPANQRRELSGKNAGLEQSRFSSPKGLRSGPNGTEKPRYRVFIEVLGP